MKYQPKNPSVNRGNLVAELMTMRSIGVTGGLNSQFDYLPCGYKVLRPDGDEVDSFLEGGEVDLV